MPPRAWSRATAESPAFESPLRSSCLSLTSAWSAIVLSLLGVLACQLRVTVAPVDCRHAVSTADITTLGGWVDKYNAPDPENPAATRWQGRHLTRSDR